MIRSFLHFYYGWRKYRGRWASIKCAWSLMWMHHHIDNDIKKIGISEYIKKIKKEIK